MVWPPLDVPYFGGQGHFMKADWDQPGGFRHASGRGGECVNGVFAFDRRARIVETYNECD